MVFDCSRKLEMSQLERSLDLRSNLRQLAQEKIDNLFPYSFYLRSECDSYAQARLTRKVRRTTTSSVTNIIRQIRNWFNKGYNNLEIRK